MRSADRSLTVPDMDKRDGIDGLRASETGEKLAIGKQERELADGERQLAREMKEVEDAEKSAEREIQDELRREHWGKEPERPVRLPNHEK
jgi:hypothetical protein